MDVFWATTVAIVFGFTIELFFQVVKYKDSLNSSYPVPTTAYSQLTDASSYLSVSQYLSLGKRKWINYFLFRLTPPFILLVLLCGVLNRYFSISDPLLFIFLSSIVSLLPRDIFMLFKADLISERIIHAVNCIFVLLLSFGVSILAKYISFSFLVPSVNGLIDNLWSSLLVAMLVIFYFKVTNMRSTNDEARTKDITVSNYVTSSYMTIKDKYWFDITSACDKYQCSIPLLYSILIYENMNRPALMRTLENQLVKIFKLELTVGIAQIRSNKPLTDKESIYSAAKILSNTRYINISNKSQEYLDAINKYNVGNNYADSVYTVLDKLRRYAFSIF